MTAKQRAQIEAARKRTIATPLASARAQSILNTHLATTIASDPITYDGFAATRIKIGDEAETIDISTLTKSRESTQAIVDSRHRINASAIKKGEMVPYSRVIQIVIREVE